jgi:cell division ATPase FtsA
VKVSVATAEKKYERPSKVSVRDAENLAGGGNVVYFTIDGGKPILNAVGFKAEKIVEAQVATTTFAVEFTSVIKKCLAAAPSFRHVNFIPIAKAEANYLIDSAVRDGTCVLISSKMFSTSAAVVSGDEICAIETFDMGTAHIENDISLVLNVGYHKAHEMFANYKGAHDNLDAIVRARVDDIGEQITAAISKMGKGLLEFPFFICGGYLDLAPGAVETKKKNLNVKIGTLGCPFNEVNLPDVVSNDAVISMSF